MAKPDFILIEGRAYSWRELCEQRCQQIEAWQNAQPKQSALFELKTDHRPAAERTPAGRYQEPTFLPLMISNRDP
jgi:hypothetical protein